MNRNGPKKLEATREEARLALAKNKGDRPTRGRGRPPARSLEQAALEQAKKIDVKGGTCPSCKKPTSDGEKFCPHCGVDLAGNVCASCRAPMKPGAPYCPACGKERVAKDKPAIAAGAPPTLAELAAQPSKMDGQAQEKKDGEPGKPLVGEVVVPPSVVLSPMAQRMIRPEATRLLYAGISKELAKRGITDLTDDECKMLGDDLSDLIQHYLHVDPKYAILVRCAIDHLIVFGPKITVAMLAARRKEEREQKTAADKGKPAPMPPVVA